MPRMCLRIYKQVLFILLLKSQVMKMFRWHLRYFLGFSKPYQDMNSNLFYFIFLDFRLVSNKILFSIVIFFLANTENSTPPPLHLTNQIQSSTIFCVCKCLFRFWNSKDKNIASPFCVTSCSQYTPCFACWIQTSFFFVFFFWYSDNRRAYIRKFKYSSRVLILIFLHSSWIQTHIHKCVAWSCPYSIFIECTSSYTQIYRVCLLIFM